MALRILNIGMDIGTPAGRLMYDVLAAVAQIEHSLLIERTMRGLAAARARGREGGRPVKLSDKQLRTAPSLRDEGSLSIAEIAAQVGVSRGTLYRNRDRAAATEANRTA